MSEFFEKLQSTAALSGANAAFIEALYENWLENPDQLDKPWRDYFESLVAESETANQSADVVHSHIRKRFAQYAKYKHKIAVNGAGITEDVAEKQISVLRIINIYRYRGYQVADTDPINYQPRRELVELNPEHHHLFESDMDKEFHTGSLFASKQMKLRDVLEFIKRIYCGHIGFEYMHITSTRQKRWLQKRIEGYEATPVLDGDDKRWILGLLTAAEGLERYLHARYVGQKRFSLEGAESLIPMLDEIIQRAGRHGADEIVIGMAHRGRLNVLTNILGKPPSVLFDEFEDRKKSQGIMTAGDVKYHMGFSADIATEGGPVHVALGFNPSHLEIITPVIEGAVKARQVRRKISHLDNKVIPIVIHGDASIAGQGVVMETLQLSHARGFQTGGTLHIVVNNQIGFTTSNPIDTRSTANCTDIGKLVEAPVFHVNGDDPEAIIFVTRLALDFRNRFNKDVIIDIICYRRLGHNEADEPAVTQPKMYANIRKQPTTRVLYANKLAEQGIISEEKAQQLVTEYRNALDKAKVVSRPALNTSHTPYEDEWQDHIDQSISEEVETGIAREEIQRLALKQLEVPDGFRYHARIRRIFKSRKQMAMGETPMDWGFAENLAYASLLNDSYSVRLCGQDSGRGTFFHRHAIILNQETAEPYVPLKSIASDTGVEFTIINSLLSEEAVLGFEYGYSTTDPHTLTIWEAQFGDFANVAQVVIDQFIASGAAKWGILCGLTMLLPHGQEGQGAEHSSARLERFLQLCSESNMQVVVPTTPAQIFHLLRRQMLRKSRLPLIVMSPKSLLRHSLATSFLDELEKGRFQSIIPEIDPIDANKVERVILCTGKVYYELLEHRRHLRMDNVAIIRIEELYPFPRRQYREILGQYKKAKDIIWCQEEPQNQGAWDQIKHRLIIGIGKHQELYYVGRASSPAPAPGYAFLFRMQQETLIEDALQGNINPKMNWSNK